jgi:hypothetical protein
MKSYRFTILTLFLGVFFSLPFKLKLVNSSLEIYPAIIFPSGASLVKTENNTKTVYVYELYGFRDSLEIIDKIQFLNGIPMKYFHSIIQGGFGLGEFKNEIKLFNGTASFTERNYPSESSISATRKWLKERLIDQDMKDSVFVLRQYEIEYDLTEKNITSKTVINENVFNLD